MMANSPLPNYQISVTKKMNVVTIMLQNKNTTFIFISLMPKQKKILQTQGQQTVEHITYSVEKHPF